MNRGMCTRISMSKAVGAGRIITENRDKLFIKINRKISGRPKGTNLNRVLNLFTSSSVNKTYRPKDA